MTGAVWWRKHCSAGHGNTGVEAAGHDNAGPEIQVAALDHHDDGNLLVVGIDVIEHHDGRRNIAMRMRDRAAHDGGKGE